MSPALMYSFAEKPFMEKLQVSFEVGECNAFVYDERFDLVKHG